jgi:hypothetical protein
MPKTSRKRSGIPRPKSRTYPDSPQTDLSAARLEPMPEIDASVRATHQRLYGSAHRSEKSGGGWVANGSGNGNGNGHGDSLRQSPRSSRVGAMASKKPNTRIVSSNREKGGWDVRAPNAERASAHTQTQAEADKRAAEILRNIGGGERITKGRDGRIRSKDTIPPRQRSQPAPG